MMAGKGDELTVQLESTLKRPRENQSPKVSKRKPSASLPLTKQEEEKESLSVNSFMFKAVGSTVVHDVHSKKMESLQSPAHSVSKSAPSEPMNMVEEYLLPKPLPLDEFTSPTKGGAIHKPGGKAHVGGVNTSNLSADETKGEERSSLPKNPDIVNADIKQQLMKEVRQFGRKYEKIFKLLEGVQGPPELKKQFVEFTIKEAARFKRRDLIKHLENILEKTIAECYLNKDNHSLDK
ncbi:integrator complex subunit 6-like [Ochotona princeps]|uniref:integrator complex subunit 6-like n=1 Tax=Ochotona princeps TaxID=9978 RepID=UPI00271558CD|nr:integrator complex subunit 6-like [Ochotona princeps]XP_058515044.1 integrator complex subunit 6-like [Ochotona princeps]